LPLGIIVVTPFANDDSPVEPSGTKFGRPSLKTQEAEDAAAAGAMEGKAAADQKAAE